MRSAQDHERFDYVLGMTIERMQECEPVTGRARHDILTLDKSADEPVLVPDQTQSASQIREFLDDSGFGIGLQAQELCGWSESNSRDLAFGELPARLWKCQCSLE